MRSLRRLEEQGIDMLHYFIQLNYATITVLVFMFAFIFSNRYFDKSIRLVFGTASFFVFVLVVVDSIEFYTASLAYPTLLRVWMSAIGYALRPSTIFLISVLISRGRKRKLFLMALPLFLNALISFSALFTDIAFSYDEKNEFVRGSLGFSAYITSVFYLGMLVVVTLQRYREENTTEAYISIAVSGMSVIATYMEAVAGYDGMINVTGAISIMAYYLYLNAQQFKRDALTNVLNRRCFYMDAEKEKANITAVISIDLNNLKQLNDTYGHAKGDEAICTMVSCVRKVLLKKSSLYRTGGDEFMILCFRQNREKVDTMIQRLREEMQKTQYSCAIGRVFVEEGQEVEQLCALADEAMYQDKVRMKKEMAK